jgi:hypothetical protein
LKRLLKPSGTLIVAVLILNLSMQNITALFAAYDANPFWHFSKKAIKHFLKRRHAIRKVLPMKFDSFM